jgi:hypothetical protein
MSGSPRHWRQLAREFDQLDAEQRVVGRDIDAFLESWPDPTLAPTAAIDAQLGRLRWTVGVIDFTLKHLPHLELDDLSADSEITVLRKAISVAHEVIAELNDAREIAAVREAAEPARTENKV